VDVEEAKAVKNQKHEDIHKSKSVPTFVFVGVLSDVATMEKSVVTDHKKSKMIGNICLATSTGSLMNNQATRLRNCLYDVITWLDIALRQQYSLAGTTRRYSYETQNAFSDNPPRTKDILRYCVLVECCAIVRSNLDQDFMQGRASLRRLANIGALHVAVG
jgi:hypothetical protein